MARGQIAELGLGGGSFDASSSSRALVARRTAACVMCLLSACVLAVALSGSSRTVGASALRDVNQFEESSAFNAEWDEKELQHHLVQTQRMMTTSDNQIAEGIQKLDHGVEVLMKLIRHRPAGDAGVPGNPGKAGAKGPNGEAGKDGPPGAAGVAGAQGKAGPNGVPGVPGNPGEAGADGQAGRPGNFGPPGAMGKAGAPGQMGQRGQVGRKGRHGWEGPPGPAGVPAYLHAVHHYPYEDTDTSDAEDAAHDPEEKQMGGSSALRTQRRQQSLRQSDERAQGEGTAEDAYKRTLSLGWKKEGDLSVAQVRIENNKGYEVHVAAPRGDAIRATLRGEDGFHKTWKGTSSLVSGAIAAGAPGSADFLKVTDRTRDETQYFSLPK